jgi:hypothetical protein
VSELEDGCGSVLKYSKMGPVIYLLSEHGVKLNRHELFCVSLISDKCI